MVLIDKQSRVPAYEQIRNQLLTLILVGTFAPHSQLPSIRSIATDAGVNINTVKKAFKNDSVHDTAVSEVSDAISAARAKGLKKQEIIDILYEIYTQEEEL